jgi:hypothetical protein
LAGDPIVRFYASVGILAGQAQGPEIDELKRDTIRNLFVDSVTMDRVGY